MMISTSNIEINPMREHNEAREAEDDRKVCGNLKQLCSKIIQAMLTYKKKCYREDW